MFSKRVVLVSALSATLLFCAPGANGQDKTVGTDSERSLQLFNDYVSPLLSKHCYECHSHESRKAESGLVLDSRSGLLTGGLSGPAITPSNPDASLILKAINYEDDELQMPPDGKLSEEDIKHLTEWIRLGAVDPRISANNTKSATADELWSLAPLKESPAPDVIDGSWPQNDIDRFVLSKLEANDLQPVKDASPVTLLRRLHFDLIGLPPTADQVASWDSQNLTSLVDELLTSPRFGERWGRHWLDLVRFAESNGGDRNVVHQHAWRYRNYVIDAFNSDKPYDQFIREQIAGDLLEASSQQARDSQLVATGMLTLGRKLFMETDSEQFRMDRVDEQIDVVTRSVLGLTVSCARCHDHKFDPISTANYYSLAGIFRSTFLMYGPAAPAGNQYGHDRPLQPIGKDAETLQGPAEEWNKRVADKTSERNKARSDRYRVVRDKAAQENKLKMAVGGKTKEQQAADEKITALNVTIAKLAEEIKVWDEKIKTLDEELKQITDNPPQFPDYCMAVRDDEKIEDCKICIRGSVKRRGDAAPRGFLDAISFHFTEQIPADQSGRVQLATWLTHPENPLTPRVIVNRVWQHLFGEGLVRSVDNFGSMGERPSHPELLDYLARQFVADGWSIKKLIGRIVLSRTYQLSSSFNGKPKASAQFHAKTAASGLPLNEIDPENRLLWRQNSRQLEAEPLRDAILAVSGHLDVEPPAGSVISTIAEREFNSRVRLTPEQLSSKHRSIYLPIARFHLSELFDTFDFPDPSLVVGKRGQRTMASQQLFLLNNPWVLEQAEAAAKRLLDSDKSDNTRLIELAYQRFFGRDAILKESEQALNYLNEEQTQAESSAEGRMRAWTRFCQAMMASGEFRTIE